MTQQISFGIQNLPKIIKEINSKKLFLVSGSSFHSLDIKSQVERLEVGKIYFSDFTPNPLYEQVCKGIELFEKEKCDAILVIGGGSAIDVAKCIKLAILAKEGYNAIIPPLVNSCVACEGFRLPLIAIPTTAGSGSESTHNAVIYYRGVKQTVTNEGILPEYAILESSVLSKLPLYQKKCTLMDALCQSIESWWSVNSTEESHKYSRKAIELIMSGWDSYLLYNDTKAAESIMLGANYAGRAINITATTAAHAMSYKITSLYKLPHGHAVACCLPYIWKHMVANMDKTTDKRGSKYLKDIFFEIASSMGCETVEAAILLFENMMNKMDLKQPILNSPKEIDVLTESVNSLRLKNNPVFLSKEDLRNLYSEIIK